MPRPNLPRAAALLLVGSLAACGVTDGQLGDPPGSATGRTTDRVLGTNMSGAYPAQSDGTARNPAGTMVERAIDPAHLPVRRDLSAPNH